MEKVRTYANETIIKLNENDIEHIKNTLDIIKEIRKCIIYNDRVILYHKKYAITDKCLIEPEKTYNTLITILHSLL